jgi:hypothetical protein
MVKRTGVVIEDKLWVKRDGKPNTFKIHFPHIVNDNPLSMGVTVTVDQTMLRELKKKITTQLMVGVNDDWRWGEA